VEIKLLSVDELIEPLIIVREDLETADFWDLVQDIKEHGVEIPLIVRLVEEGPRIVDGYRRWRAARKAGLLEVPCEVREMEDAEEIALLMRVAVHRQDFTPLEEGKMFATMHEGLHMTYEGIAEEVGKSRDYVMDRLNVVRGPEEVRQALAIGEITLTVAKELLRVTHDQDRAYLLHWARTQGASGATVRGWIQERLQARAMTPDAPAPATAAEGYGTAPVLTGLCDWHRGLVRLEEIHNLRVCDECWFQLETIRRRLVAQSAAGEGGNPHAPSS